MEYVPQPWASDPDQFSFVDSDYFEKLDSRYDNERELYRALQTEFINIKGTPCLWYIVSYNKDHDKVYGEDNDRRIERAFKFMGLPESLPEERQTFTFQIEGLDSFILWIDKDHFADSSSRNLPSFQDATGLMRTDFSLNHLTEDNGTGSVVFSEDFMNNEFTTEFDIGSPFSSYIPKVGDIVKMIFNDYLYEVKAVKEEDEMFHQHKHSWSIRLGKWKNERLNVDQNDINEPDISRLINQGVASDITDDINNHKEGIIIDPPESFAEGDSGKGRSRILFTPEGELKPNHNGEGW